MKTGTVNAMFMVMLVSFSLVISLSACSSPKQEAAKPVDESVAPAEVQESAPDTTTPEEETAEESTPVLEKIDDSVIKIDGAETEEKQNDVAGDALKQGHPEKRVIMGAPEQPEMRDPADFMPEKRPYAESAYAEQIDKGLAWLAANEGQRNCNWMDYFVLDYLQRKFGLDESFAAEEIINLEKADQDSKVLMALYARLVREGYKLGDIDIPIEDVSLFADYQRKEDETLVTANTLAYLGTSLSGAMLRAMYCDQAAVDEAFVNEVVRQARETEFKGSTNSFGGYVVSHMVLAYKWLKENGCAEAFESLAGIEEELAGLLAVMVDDQQVVTDLGMEAVALLHYLGRSDQIKEEWPEAIAAAQMPEGCWDRQGGQSATPVPQGHPTAFALWVLLEDALPEAADIPWLR